MRLLLLVPLLAGTAHAAPIDTPAERAKPCLVCHGATGRTLKTEYAPRLHGKPAQYLLNQMTGFRDGRRQHRAMALLMQHLDDDYLRMLAEWFAAEAPAYDAPRTPNTAPPPQLVREGDAERKIPACTACHGADLMGRPPAIPGLLGLPRDYLSAQFGAWRVGIRHAVKPDCMAEVAKRMTADEINGVAGWLAAEKVPAVATAAPAKPLPMDCGGGAK